MDDHDSPMRTVRVRREMIVHIAQRIQHIRVHLFGRRPVVCVRVAVALRRHRKDPVKNSSTSENTKVSSSKTSVVAQTTASKAQHRQNK